MMTVPRRIDVVVNYLFICCNMNVVLQSRSISVPSEVDCSECSPISFVSELQRRTTEQDATEPCDAGYEKVQKQQHRDKCQRKIEG